MNYINKMSLITLSCAKMISYVNHVLLPIEIIQYIFDYCDFKTSLSLHSCCAFYNALKITNLYDINKNILQILTDKLINQEKYLVPKGRLC